MQRAWSHTNNYNLGSNWDIREGIWVYRVGTKSLRLARVREGLAEVTIFESGQGRQIEFQRTGRVSHSRA